MTINNKNLLGCGIVTAIVLVMLVAVCIWLSSGKESGVHFANEIDQYALDYIRDHQILIHGEVLIAYYDDTIQMDGTEAAILTTKRIIYHKDGRNNAIDLSSIQDIHHKKVPLAGDIIEVYASSGHSMKIEIAPLNGGETYRSALMRAWKNAKIGLDASEQKTSVEDMLDR
jgi:hypothetical protein